MAKPKRIPASEGGLIRSTGKRLGEETSYDKSAEFDRKPRGLVRSDRLNKDLRSYWIKAIQEMSDAEIAAFDAKARALSIEKSSANKLEPGMGPSNSIPRVAPELYADRKDKAEKIDRFLVRIYGQWCDGINFSRADLRRLDSKAASSLAVWLQDNELPGDLNLPTEWEVRSKRSALADVEQAREMSRLARRHYRGKKLSD